MTPESNLFTEQRKLVLARFKTLNPDGKIMLGGQQEMTVRDLIDHIEQGDDLGRKIVHVHMKMLQVLIRGAE